ncbi:MAG: NAD-dependent epimerase/dehydratase family protein [Muribaculaceae bacterium]|nr:NAD-dependent epimerase/dehydratase family protein [Muribaculaceae bacterium]
MAGKKILVTGARGFVGKNLCSQLLNIKTGKVACPGVEIDEVFEYDIDSTAEDFEHYCGEADFVFHLAGVNRPPKSDDFKNVNVGFTARLIETLDRHGNRCPIMFSSSIHARQAGRYAGHPYGESKRECEELLFNYARQAGVNVMTYRFPNIFGKWCRPNYNSVIATFCYNIANGLPIKINNPDERLELVYIDDLVEEMIEALNGREHRAGIYCEVETTHTATLGEIARMLEKFSKEPETLIIPDLTPGGLEKKLYSTYLSYLPKEKMCYPLKMNVDARGSFTEIIKTVAAGQFSVNISRPGIVKGEHWHHSKNEKFVVVKGHGLIKLRNEYTDEVLNFEVCGERMQVVEMIPGYTHSIQNLSDSEDLITLIWCNEVYNPDKPDTYSDKV